MGFVININGIVINPEKVVAIRNYSMLVTITKIKGFINGVGYFKHLIKNYLKINSKLNIYYIKPKGKPVNLLQTV